jgi:hypothetical protein
VRPIGIVRSSHAFPCQREHGPGLILWADACAGTAAPVTEMTSAVRVTVPTGHAQGVRYCGTSSCCGVREIDCGPAPSGMPAPLEQRAGAERARVETPGGVVSSRGPGPKTLDRQAPWLRRLALTDDAQRDFNVPSVLPARPKP